MAITSATASSMSRLVRSTEAKLDKLEGKLERVLVKEHQVLKDLRKVLQQHTKAEGRAGQAQDGFDAGKKGAGEASRAIAGEWAPLDVGALRETNKLDKSKGPVTADELTRAIERGTADLDGNAAGGEYRAFSEWATKNQDRLTPEAKKVMDLYSQAAAKGDGKGISLSDWKQMVKDMKAVKDPASVDKGAAKALEGLDKLPKPISGEQMAKAIQSGVRDADNNTGKELKQFQDWAKKNDSKLSPEAKKVMSLFEQHAKKAMATGDKDLSASEMSKMQADFKKVGDLSANKALAKLDKEQGPISGEDLLGAIKEGVGDKDNNTTGTELKAFQDWAKKNKDRMTPEAEKVLQTYEKAAKAAGSKGMDQKAFDAMVKDASQHKTFRDDSVRTALETLDGKSGKVSAKDLTNAIKKGTADLDGQAAGVEFADIQKWARQNYDRLTPEAKKVLDVYEKYATEAMSKGSTGIPTSELQKMVKEMEKLDVVKPRPVIVA
ncbi:hypothetical protein NVS55_39450 [Myxococcus stipitatus]|uniref:hypothetical protein n=1 Tax=Myxococcus stipitatus TaxID=83455 RepID=UPI00314508C5